VSAWTSTAEDTTNLERAAAEGIHCLPVPTPFGIGDVNCYLVEDDPLTLVDCGPNSGTALLALERGLAARGHAIEDVELLVVTHQHIDHCGLAHIFAARGHAEVACLDLFAPVLEDLDRHAARDDDDAQLLMQRHGVEDHVSEALRSVADVVRGYGAPSRVDRRLHDGSVLELRDRTLSVHHRPGHSPSDTILHDAERKLMFSGDHLLGGVSSNALISRPLDPAWDRTRPRTLVEYRASLTKTAAMDVELVLGGHRGPVTDHAALIGKRMASHERRAQDFHDKLAGGPLTAHEIATATWGSVAITQAFLTLSEVIGHLDLLAAEGAVVEDRSEHVIRFART
jgi:glyoxylase-like metal-dependent hydrolase (beta-lactamase superfamily II)